MPSVADYRTTYGHEYHPGDSECRACGKSARAPLTATEMIPAVGQQVAVTFESCKVFCEVRDVKYSWGKPRLLVSPVSGDGQQWVELSRVSPITHSTTSKSGGIRPASEHIFYNLEAK